MVESQTLVGASNHTQTTAYDDYGNITQMVTNGATLNTPTNSTTNRLALGGSNSTYDGAGNLTRLATGGETYTYDYDYDA